MAKSKGNLIGGWAFLIGVILAIVLGAMGPVSGTILTVLVVLGLIVGFLNVADEETTPFLMSGIALIIASSFGGDSLSSITIAGQILDALMAIFVPATIIVAVKNVFSLAKN